MSKLLCHAIKDIFPIVELLLPEQADGRIPGAVVAIEHPAEIGRKRKESPDPLPKRARQMHYRSVDRDHGIEERNDGRGVGKILDLLAEPQHVRMLAQGLPVACAELLLQAYEL